MATDQGIIFCSTSTYPSPFPANCTYCLAEGYPTVRNAWTFGWSVALSVQSRDRDNTITNQRLVGINFTAITTVYFQLDLPATGSTDIHLGAGDATSDGLDANWLIRDTTTTIITISKSNLTHLHYMDATNVERTSVSDWTNNEAATTYTMTTTALRLLCNSSITNVAVAFFRAVQGSASAPPFTDRLMMLGIS